MNNLSFVLDYLAACDEGDTAVYQVGNGQMDHTWWGPVELLEYGMKDNGADYTKARAALRGTSSAVCGEMAAALAAGACAPQGQERQDRRLSETRRESLPAGGRDPERRRLQQQRCQRILPFVPLL